MDQQACWHAKTVIRQLNWLLLHKQQATQGVAAGCWEP
jgi:hypothetical protein